MRPPDPTRPDPTRPDPTRYESTARESDHDQCIALCFVNPRSPPPAVRFSFFSWERGDSRPAPRNSRWNDGGGGGGGGGGRGGVNAKGFHGNMNEDPRLEKALFNTEEHASQGINFDRVRGLIRLVPFCDADASGYPFCL